MGGIFRSFLGVGFLLAGLIMIISSKGLNGILMMLMGGLMIALGIGIIASERY